MPYRPTGFLFSLVCAAALLASGSIGISRPAAAQTLTVGIVQLLTHPALDAGRDGAVQALADAGFEDGDNIRYDLQNAQGDFPTITTIAQRFRDTEVELIVTVSTQALQGVLGVFEDGTTPIVFNTVVDPYVATQGVIKSPTDKPANVTGVQSLPPVKEAMALAQQIVPGAERFGMLWSPREANSEIATEMARVAAEELGIELVEASVNSSDEVLLAAQSLAAKNVDVFFVSTDSTVGAALESVVRVANETDTPLIANDPASASRGAVAALGVDYYQAGYDSGTMAAEILGGRSAADIPIMTSNASFLAVNTEAAELQGIELPEDVLSEARITYDQIATPEP